MRRLYFQTSLKLIPMVPNQNSDAVAQAVGQSLKVNFHNMKKAAMVLRAMNHKLRQQILALIDSEKKITVTEIYVRLRLEQSVASQHLAILRKSGIVNTIRDGKFIHYSVNHKRIAEINKFVNELIG